VIAGRYGAGMEIRLVRMTDRFDETCAFYGDLLAWPVTHQWPADEHEGRGRLFGYGNARIELIEIFDGAAAEPLRGGFLSVEVDGVVALRDRIVAAGHRLDSEVAEQPWGHRSFSVLDPAGAKLVFFEAI
jgi:catechol 2,3-dioxygenase-like lactoylglutathione lyase family enzyme